MLRDENVALKYENNALKEQLSKTNNMFEIAKKRNRERLNLIDKLNEDIN